MFLQSCNLKEAWIQLKKCHQIFNALNICSGCDEKALAAYICHDCKENLCASEAYFAAHKKVRLTRSHNNVINVFNLVWQIFCKCKTH